MRLTATPQGAIARRYRVMANGAPVTEIGFPPLGPSTATPIDGKLYRLRRTGVLRDHFTLESSEGGAVVASASQDDPLRREFAVKVGDHRLLLRAESALRSDYLLLDGEQTIGSLRPTDGLRHGLDAELPDDLPRVTQIFLVWVVLLLWQRRRITRAGM